jgi:hypothetical protein
MHFAPNSLNQTVREDSMADFTIGNFFRYYAAHPNQAPEKDRAKAKFYATLFFLATLTLGTIAVKIISKIRWKTFDDFDYAQFKKTHQVAGQRFGASDWVKDVGKGDRPLQLNIDPTPGLEDVTDKLFELKQLSQTHQTFMERLVVRKERRKDKNYQFNNKTFKDLQQSIKELKNLAERGKKKKVEINAPLKRADKARLAYEAEKIRFEELVTADNAFQPDAY